MYHPEKVEGFSQHLLNHLCNGYSFMMLDENIDLRDQFDQVIEEMKEDGTLEELVKIHITDAAKSGEPEAVVFGMHQKLILICSVCWTEDWKT